MDTSIRKKRRLERDSQLKLNPVSIPKVPASEFHTVVIDPELKPIEIASNFTSVSKESIEQIWLHKVNENKNLNYKPLFTVTNGPCTEIPYEKNPILQAFLLAYNNHQDLILSPDDMWLLVCLKFAAYVNDNAEKLRSLFVEHNEGKKTLAFYESAFSDFDWNHFFDAMKSEIDKNVKNGVNEILTANFSTTGKIESILSAACIMHTFQPYFEYRGMMCYCGIRQVHFMGTLDDWKLLRVKTEKLKMFCFNDPAGRDRSWSPSNRFKSYIDGILPIFDQFIETYQGRVDQEFWIKVCDTTRATHQAPYGIGKPIVYQRLTGWVLKLVDMEEKKLENIRVPVSLINQLTKTTKQCFIVGGFHGVLSTKDYKHKPVMSLTVVEQVTKDSKVSETTKR